MVARLTQHYNPLLGSTTCTCMCKRPAWTSGQLWVAGLFWQVLQDGRLKAPEELARMFKGAGVDPGKPIVASCGTGVTASVLALALHQLAPASQVRNTACVTLCDIEHIANTLVQTPHVVGTEQYQIFRVIDTILQSLCRLTMPSQPVVVLWGVDCGLCI